MADQPLTDYQKVVEFHQKFKQPQVDGPPSLEAIEDRIHLRMDLIAEEFEELIEAVYGPAAAKLFLEVWPAVKAADEGARDLIATTDALGDLKVVINGFGVEANIDLDAVVSEVHASNMSKLDEEGEPIVSDGLTPDPRDGKVKPKGKILKGPNFFEPNLERVLFKGE